MKIWLPFPINSKYLISNYGEVKNKKTGRTLKPWLNKVGYWVVRLGSKSPNYSIHRMVALTFISNPENKQYVNHKDGNKLNNYVNNLEWVTASENCLHSFQIGLSKKRFGHKDSVGSKNSMSKLNEEFIKDIRNKYNTGRYTYEKLANEYNVSLATIGYIIQRKTWSHI